MWWVLIIGAVIVFIKGQTGPPASTQSAVNANSATLGPGPQGYSSSGTGPGAGFACGSAATAPTNPPRPTVANFWTAQPWNSRQVEPWSVSVPKSNVILTGCR